MGEIDAVDRHDLQARIRDQVREGEGTGGRRGTQDFRRAESDLGAGVVQLEPERVGNRLMIHGAMWRIRDDEHLRVQGASPGAVIGWGRCGRET
jgi:hypothetical protein